jgi:hypothetical protein
MSLLLYRIALVPVAAFFTCVWIWSLIGMLRRSRGAAWKGGSAGWPDLILSLGACLFLIGLASEEPHRAYPIVITGVGIIVMGGGLVLRRRER